MNIITDKVFLGKEFDFFSIQNGQSFVLAFLAPAGEECRSVESSFGFELFLDGLAVGDDKARILFIQQLLNLGKDVLLLRLVCINGVCHNKNVFLSSFEPRAYSVRDDFDGYFQ